MADANLQKDRQSFNADIFKTYPNTVILALAEQRYPIVQLNEGCSYLKLMFDL